MSNTPEPTTGLPGIALVFRATARPEKRQELLDLLAGLVASVADEPGTVAYVLHQDNRDENTFVMYETYRDQAAFEAHGGGAQLGQFRALLPDLVAASPEISLLTPLESKA